MIKFENAEVVGWGHAIRGMRNPMNSWDKSDSDYRPILCKRCDNCTSYQLKHWEDCDKCEVAIKTSLHNGFMIGPNDVDLMKRLHNAGTDHRKFMRMITVYLDITAPLYWWKEFDTYRVGVEKNSCSTMHKIHAKEFTMDDFSCEKLYDPLGDLRPTVDRLNVYRERYLETKDKNDWWQMIQLLPSSYNQKRTVMMNYEVLANIYKSRRNHKLDEWRCFCVFIESFPYSELITGQED